MAEMIFLEPDDHRRYKKLFRTYPEYYDDNIIYIRNAAERENIINAIITVNLNVFKSLVEYRTNPVLQFLDEEHNQIDDYNEGFQHPEDHLPVTAYRIIKAQLWGRMHNPENRNYPIFFKMLDHIIGKKHNPDMGASHKKRYKSKKHLKRKKHYKSKKHLKRKMA